jgi:hypothetical protein
VADFGDTNGFVEFSGILAVDNYLKNFCGIHAL